MVALPGRPLEWWCGLCAVLLSTPQLSADAASFGPTLLSLTRRMAPWGKRRLSFLETRDQDQGIAEPLRYTTRLFVASLKMGDGSNLDVLVDTGSGNLIVPSEKCDTAGCGSHRRFQPDGDASGHFLGGDAADIHMSYVTGDLGGVGFEGRVCFSEACGTMRFIVATWESDDFASFKFDAILGLGPKRQSWAEGFNFVESLAQQSALQTATFALDLRNGDGDSSLVLGVEGAPPGAAAQWAAASNSSSSNASLSGGVQWLPADGDHGEWAVPLADVVLGGLRLGACGSGGCRAVLDSGCGGIALPGDVAQRVKSKLDISNCSAIGNLPQLGFIIGGRLFNVGPERYVEISKIDASHCRLLVHEHPEGSETTAILGLPFLFDRRTIFDVTSMMVGVQ